MAEKIGSNPEELQENESIVETETSVSYLGVKLEKAEDSTSQFVPKKEQYADFINDRDIALPLQRDIAVSFLSGEPLLVDGGTSLGKTTTVRKMCSDLGWEIHYANLNGATDVEDLMGRYIPNPNKNKPEDPEYVFADGKVTSGLRQEEGKTKVIILDEFNASAPNILIRLHEVLDALERGGDVTLSEDASEVVKVDKQKTKIVALMNPPGKGYFGREPLDPAQLRRWVYKKLPSELPKDTFSYATNALFGTESNVQEVPQELFLKSQEQALSVEQLQEVPGMTEILEKFKEFHIAAKELLKTRKIAEDQPQPFTYDDRMEPRRVRDFVLRFYSGDINETFQHALRYYYANKLETDADRKKMEELIRMVECKMESSESRRKGLKREKPEKGVKPEKAEGEKTEVGEARKRADRALDSLLKNPNVPDEIKESLAEIDLQAETEMESSFQEQYDAQIDVMKRIGMMTQLESGEWGIEGIDGKEYPAPTPQEIAEKIEANKELIEKKREQGFTRLLLVPFAHSLDNLATVYEQSILKHSKEGKLFASKKNPGDQNEQLVPLELDENQPLWKWDGYNDADINGSLVYGPKEFSENHGGKTKQEVIAEQGGWQVLFIEDMPNIPRGNPETKGGRTQIDTGGSSIKKYIKRGEDIPSPSEYLKAIQKESVYQDESGMTPEAQLAYSILHLEETNQVIDDYRGNGRASYQVGAYFPASGVVPVACWYRDARRACLGRYYPDFRDDFCGVRSAVRI